MAEATTTRPAVETVPSDAPLRFEPSSGARTQALPTLSAPQPQPPTPPVPAALDRLDFVETVRGGADGSLELSLRPEDLGRVRLTFSGPDHALAVTISTERPETLDLMRRHLDALAADLRDSGYGRLDFSFADDGQNQSAPDDDRPPVDIAEPAPTDTPRRMAGAAALDIRL